MFHLVNLYNYVFLFIKMKESIRNYGFNVNKCIDFVFYVVVYDQELLIFECRHTVYLIQIASKHLKNLTNHPVTNTAMYHRQ